MIATDVNGLFKISGLDRILGRYRFKGLQHLIFCKKDLLAIHLESVLIKSFEGFDLMKDNSHFGKNLHAGVVQGRQLSLLKRLQTVQHVSNFLPPQT